MRDAKVHNDCERTCRVRMMLIVGNVVGDRKKEMKCKDVVQVVVTMRSTSMTRQQYDIWNGEDVEENVAPRSTPHETEEAVLGGMTWLMMCDADDAANTS